MARRSIQTQISEVAAEIEMRRQVYPRQVSKGKLRASEADYKIETMVEVRKSLEWLEANMTKVRAFVQTPGAMKP